MKGDVLFKLTFLKFTGIQGKLNSINNTYVIELNKFAMYCTNDMYFKD